MVVVVEAGLLEPLRLIEVEHAERHAGFHAEGFHALDHGEDRLHVALLGAAPGGTHAIARGARVKRLSCLGDDALDLHQLRGFEA